MFLFSAMLVLGSIELALAQGEYVGSFLCALGGLGMFWPSIFLLRRFYRIAAGKDPDPPGTKPANSDWLSGRLYDGQIGKIVLLLLVSGAFAGTITFLSIVNAKKTAYQIEHEGIPWLFASFIGLMFAAMINWMIQIVRAWLRYGKGELRLVTGPGRIGGAFDACLIVHGKEKLSEGLRAEITCHRSDFRHRRTNPDSHTADLLFWDEVEINPARVRRAGSEEGLGIAFSIPNGLPPSGVDERTRHTTWTVQVTSLPNAPFPVHFQWIVPVLEIGAALKT